MTKYPQKRENYRVVYPIAERPKAFFGSEGFRVVDLSVAGAKIEAGGKASKFVGRKGHVTFRIDLLSGKSIEVSGKFLRVLGTHVVFVLTMGVPVTMINQEQIYLRSRYPGHS